MPFCYISACLIVGILLARHLPNHSFLLAGLLFVLCILINCLRKVEFIVSVALIFIGNLLYILHLPKQTTQYIPKVKCIGVITSPVIHGVKHTKFVLSTIKINEKRARFKLWVLCDINSENQTGQILQITGDLIMPKKPKNPHEFDLRSYLLTQNIFYILKAHNIITLKKPPSPLHRLRNHLIFSIYKYISSPSANIIEALLTGNKYAIPTYIKEQFIDSGAYHLLVISGWHVGILVFLCYTILGWLRFGYRFRLLGCILFSILFSFFIDLQPPAKRAIITALCILSGKLFSKKTNIYNLVSFSAFIMLVENPFVLFDVSFQLSFAAVFGILKFSKPIEAKLCRLYLPYWLSCPLSTTIAAQISLMPILIYQFNKISTLAPISSIVVGVLVIVATVFAAISSIFLNFLPSYLLHVIVFVLEQIFTGLLSTVAFFANLPLATIKPPQLPLIYAALYCGLLFFYNWQTLFKTLLLILLVKANWDIYSQILSPPILQIVCFSLPSQSISLSLKNQAILLMNKMPNSFEFEYLKRYFVKENIVVRLVFSACNTNNQYLALRSGLKVYSDGFCMDVLCLDPLMIKIKFGGRERLYLKKYANKDILVEYSNQRKSFSLKKGAIVIALAKDKLNIKTYQ